MAVQGLLFEKACEAGSYLQELERHTLPGGPGTLSRVEGRILGPRCEAPSFSCLPRGLQGCYMNKCRTREFLFAPALH